MFNPILTTPGCCWLLVLLAISSAQARSYSSGKQTSEDDSLAVIPSPNEHNQQTISDDIQRVVVKQQHEMHLPAPSETVAPVYVSPFVRPERELATASLFDASSESSHAPPNYAPKPQSNQHPTRDLKTAASYGHHHHGGYSGGGGGHYEPSGWLDMGAWTGGKGSFGWYADYPVGSHSKHHYGHGRK